METGIQMSVGLPTTSPVKSRGPTPMMVNGDPFSLTVRPRMPGFRAKRVFQKSSLITITGLAPGLRSSSAENVRPIAGEPPRTSK